MVLSGLVWTEIYPSLPPLINQLAVFTETMSKITVVSIQEMKKECMMILWQKKARLVNYETSGKNPD